MFLIFQLESMLTTHIVPPFVAACSILLPVILLSVRQVTTVYCLIPGGKGSQAGRIVAAINERLITRESENVGLVGFECVPDFDIAQVLLEAACQWLRQQGMTVASPIDLHSQQLLILSRLTRRP